MDIIGMWSTSPVRKTKLEVDELMMIFMDAAKQLTIWRSSHVNMQTPKNHGDDLASVDLFATLSKRVHAYVGLALGVNYGVTIAPTSGITDFLP